MWAQAVMNRGIHLMLGAALGGCTTFGTNVSGDFRCKAPDGTCAPSTRIDDQALSAITEGDRTGFASPTGSYAVDDGIIGGASRAAVSPTRAPTGSTGGYELSVVFPAYTDAAGAQHERRVVRTSVGLPGRSASSIELANRARGLVPGGTDVHGLLAAAQEAPTLFSVGEPSATSLGPDRNVGARTRPGEIERIRADVDARLAGQPRRHAAPFTVEE